MPNRNKQNQTRNSGNIPSVFVKHDYFKNSFFPSAITEWNKLGCYISNADSFEMPNSIYNIHNPLGVKYLTKLRNGFSHLKKHKFKHSFQNSIDPMYSCSGGIETTTHFFSIAQILILKGKSSLTK